MLLALRALQLYGMKSNKRECCRQSIVRAVRLKKTLRSASRRFTMSVDSTRFAFASLTMPRKHVPAGVQTKLLRSAQKVMRNAHAPYSKFHVGAAILLSNGKIFSGCNVENASYGMTNCAERTAIFSAVAQLGPKIEIRAVAVVNDHGVACSPCGACRQVIYEFGPDAIIFFQGADGPKQAHITDLLPEGFRLQ
jgi:cytidine deaminase